MEQSDRKKIITATVVLLFVAVLSCLTACNPEHDPLVEPTETPEAEEADDNDKNDNNTMDTITIRIGEKSFTATLENDKTGNAFAALLPLSVEMSELNGNEKYYYLSKNLPTGSYRPDTIRTGDLMLYGSNCLVIFYKTFTSSYNYTRLGKITRPDGLAEALGSGKVSVTFEMNKHQ